jgi:hypothetical protein
LPKNAWRPNKAPRDIVWKGIVGGLVTAAIVWLSRRGNILPLFPTFALIALLIVGATRQCRFPAGPYRRRQDDSGLSCVSGRLLSRGRSRRLPHRPAWRARRLVYRRAGHLPGAALDLTTI